MINENTGYQYIDAVLALMPLAKFYPSDDGTYENVEWVDERTQPTAKAVADKLAELQATEGLYYVCLLYTSPSPRDSDSSRMPSSA